MGKSTKYKWQFSIATCLFTRWYLAEIVGPLRMISPFFHRLFGDVAVFGHFFQIDILTVKYVSLH